MMTATHFCPSCTVERTDHEGPHRHLPTCPNCQSAADPEPRPGWRSRLCVVCWRWAGRNLLCRHHRREFV